LFAPGPRSSHGEASREIKVSENRKFGGAKQGRTFQNVPGEHTILQAGGKMKRAAHNKKEKEEE